MNNNTIWINDLDKLVNEYNNSYHRSIKMKLINALLKSNENIVRNNLYNFKNTVKNITNNYYSNDEDEKYLPFINKKNMSIVDISDLYDQHYNFDDDKSILDSFSKIYKEHDIKYKPQSNSKFIRVRYLLKKLKDNDDVDTSLYNHFQTSLSERNKLYHKIPTYEEEELQIGSSVNNIMINDKDLNNGILRIRYLNNRKLTNNLVKHDYKISKNMVNAIKFNKDIHKLSKNEMKIYHELQKFLNKEQDINVLIGSYLSDNNSKKLYNKISSMLYNKLKNNIISKKEYTKLINKINKI